MVDRRGSGRVLAGLVDELDDRLRDSESDDDVSLDRAPVFVPTWLAFVGICAVFLAASWIVVRPTLDTCEYSETICSIEHLDIDALLLTIPDADLFDVLPSIDEIDPADELTLGDVLRLDGWGDIDPADLISPSEIDRVLRALD